MDRSPLPSERHRRRVLECQTRPLGDFPKKMQPHMRRDLPVASGHPDALHDPVTVHLGSALLVRDLYAFSKRRIPYREGLFADTPASTAHRP